MIKHQKPKDRRPQMSTLTNGRKKKLVEEMLGQEITNDYEWSEAKNPGIGLPVQIANSRT